MMTMPEPPVALGFPSCPPPPAYLVSAPVMMLLIPALPLPDVAEFSPAPPLPPPPRLPAAVPPALDRGAPLIPPGPSRATCATDD